MSDDITAKRETLPVRVLFVNSWSSCHGGSSTSLIDIVTHINRKRFDPWVLCPEPGELPERLRDLGIRVITRPIVSLSKCQVLRFLYEAVSYCRLLRRYRIRLVHENTSCWRPSIVMAAKLCQIPFVQHVRNAESNVESNFAFRFARLIITNSEYAGQPWRDFPQFRAKTKTVYNAIDLSAYDADDNRREELQVGDRPVIGFVGHVTSHKGVDTLIRAMQIVLRAVPNALLVVVGCTPPYEAGYDMKMRQLVSELGIDSSVVFTGFRRDVPAWMRTFDVFVLPTEHETFGKVVIEAMAAGCPVVVSGVGGISEIVSDPKLGTLIPPNDLKTTAQEIVRFLSDRNLARSVGNAAREHVKERFGMCTMLRKLEGLYEEVLHPASADLYSKTS